MPKTSAASVVAELRPNVPRRRTALLLLLLLGSTVSNAATTLTCSSQVGDAVLNEIYTGGGGTTPDGFSGAFIEFKILKTNVNILNWKLDYSFNGGWSAGYPYRTTLGTGVGRHYYTSSSIQADTYPSTTFSPTKWIWVEYATGVLNDNRSEVLLRDASGNVIDYLCYGSSANCLVSGGYVSGASWRVPTSCGAKLIHSSSKKDIARIPDGAGSWTDKGKAEDTTRGGNNTGASSTVHHYEIIHDGTGITCQPEQVIVKACLDSSCSSVATESSTVNLTPTTGWVAGSAQSFIGSATLEFWLTSVGSASLSVSSATPTASNPLICRNTSTGSNSCLINFFGSGLLYNVPDVTANKTSSTFTIQAVRTDATTQKCTPYFGPGTRTLKFWANYSDPATGSQTVQLNGSTISTVASGVTPATPTSLSLNFDANASANLVVRYPDAGLMVLNARYDGVIDDDDEGLVMTGFGDTTFVSSPAGFCIEARTPLSTPTATLAACTSSSCPMYQRAGNDFPWRMRAMAWEQDGETDAAFCTGNISTPNFVYTLPISHSMLDVPAIGTVHGSFTPTSVALTAGAFTGNGQFSEVGRFALANTSINYHGVALPVSSSAAIGRIVPDRYEFTLSGYDAHCSSAGAFSYAGLNAVKAGEAFPLDVTVNAVNAAGSITQNYVGAYAKLQGNTIAFTDWSAGAAATAGEFVADAHSLNFATGVGTPLITATGAAGSISSDYRFTALRAPYSVALRAEVNDSDGISGSSAEQGPIEFRLGRLIMENAYGPEQIPLPIPLRAEYFDGSSWRRNSDDYCSTYINTAVSRDQYTGTLTAALTTPSQPGSSTTLSAGLHQASAMLQLAAPGLGHYGSLRLTLSVPSWLQFDWNGDGTADAPTSTASFGRFRGSDRVLIWREELPAKP